MLLPRRNPGRDLDIEQERAGDQIRGATGVEHETIDTPDLRGGRDRGEWRRDRDLAVGRRWSRGPAAGAERQDHVTGAGAVRLRDQMKRRVEDRARTGTR